MDEASGSDPYKVGRDHNEVGHRTVIGGRKPCHGNCGRCAEGGRWGRGEGGGGLGGGGGRGARGGGKWIDGGRRMGGDVWLGEGEARGRELI